MPWNKEKINNHIKAARLLINIKDRALQFIKRNPGVTEYEVQAFILKQYKLNGLVTNWNNCIVAFRQNTSYVHYYPSQYCLKLKPESLIMIDMWARLNKKSAPFADITWMAYSGKKIPKQILTSFNLVTQARNEAINFLKTNLAIGKIPTGRAVDMAARNIIAKAGFGGNFLHTTGHSLGLNHPHGRNGRIGAKYNKPLKKNIGYTIEPAVYFKNEFGIRSEIDFYINNKMKLVITTKIQRSIAKI